MDKETLQNMPDYVKNLPKEVQDFVFDGIWEERINEIALKYTLDENQTDQLINKVLYILIGLENPEDFLESTISELNISRLLATQMLEEIEKRVFEYAVGEIEKNKNVKENSQSITPKQIPNPQPVVENKTVVTEQKENIPEVRPEIVPEIEPNILPAVEKGEVAHSNPIPTIQEPQKIFVAPNIVEKQKPEAPANLPGIEIENTFIGSDFIQKKVDVNEPKQEPDSYKKASSIPWPTEKTVSEQVEVGSDFLKPIPSKQENIYVPPQTSSPTPIIQTQAKEPQKPPIEKSYVSDPYREPIN